MTALKPVIIIGAGGHGRVVLDGLLCSGREIQGIVDMDSKLWGTNIRGVRVLGGDEVIETFSSNDVWLANGIGGNRLPAHRQSIFEKWKKNGYAFTHVIHPSAVIAKDSTLGEGCQVFAGAVIQPGAKISDNVLVNTRAVVEHDCKIGRHSHLAPGSVLSGGVEIGEGCLIGTGASVIPYKKIGDRTVIGAGAAVIFDIGSDATAVGVPARIKSGA